MATAPGGFSQRNWIHTSRATWTKLRQGKSVKCKEKVMLQWKCQACTHWHDVLKPGQGGWGFNRVPGERREEPTRSAYAVGRCQNSDFPRRAGCADLPQICCEKRVVPSQSSAAETLSRRMVGAAARQTNLSQKGASRLQPLSLPVGCSRDNAFIFSCLARALPLPPYHSTQDH